LFKGNEDDIIKPGNHLQNDLRHDVSDINLLPIVKTDNSKRASTDMQVREETAIEDVATILLQKIIVLRSCSFYKIENSKADALVEAKDPGKFVGLQFTRLNYKEEGGSDTMHKSKSQLLNYLQLGFGFIACFYLKDQLVGASFLTPEDIPKVDAVDKEFTVVTVSPFPKRSFVRGFQSGIASEIIYPNMNVWIKSGQLSLDERNKFSSKVQDFLNKSTTTYSLREISTMVCKTVLLETNYIDVFFNLLSTINVLGERLYLQKEDVRIHEKGCSTKLGVQLKMATKMNDKKNGYHFSIRKLGGEPMNSNSLDSIGVVIPMNDDFLFVLFPSRKNSTGTMKQSGENGFPRRVYCSYNELTRTFRIPSSENLIEDDFVILSQSYVSPNFLKTMKSWVTNDVYKELVSQEDLDTLNEEWRNTKYEDERVLRNEFCQRSKQKQNNMKRED